MTVGDRAEATARPAASAPAAAPAPLGPWWALIAVCVPLLAVALNTTGVQTVLPTIANDVDVSVASLGWMVTAYALATASLVVAGGRLGDRIGRRRLFQGGVVVFFVASAVIALASSEIQLIAGRALQGVGAAIIVPGSMALIDVAFPRERKPQAVGVWSAVIGLGFALGPVVGGALSDSIGWQWAWWVNLPLCALGCVLVRRAVAESRGPGAGGVDVAGAALVSAGIFALVLGLAQGRDWGWTSAGVLGAFAAAIVLLAAFAVLEPRRRSPLVHFAHFRIPAYLAANIATAALSFGLIVTFYLPSLYVQNFLLLDYSAVKAGVALMPMSFLLFAVSLVAGRIVARSGAWLPTVGGFAVLAGGLWWCGSVSLGDGYGALAPGLALVGIGLGLTMGPAAATAAGAVPPGQAGEASGVVNMSRYIGIAFGGAAAGVAYSLAASDTLAERLGADRVTAATERTLDRALSGSAAQARQALDALAPAERGELTEAMRAAIVDGFNAGMRLSALVAVAGGVACAVLLRRAAHVPHVHLHHAPAGPAGPLTGLTSYAAEAPPPDDDPSAASRSRSSARELMQ